MISNVVRSFDCAQVLRFNGIAQEKGTLLILSMKEMFFPIKGDNLPTRKRTLVGGLLSFYSKTIARLELPLFFGPIGKDFFQLTTIFVVGNGEILCQSKKTTLNFIIFDLEATCWPGKNNGMPQETIEIGALHLDRFGELQGSYNRFIKPVIHPYLSPFCKSLTTIEQEDVDRANTFPQVIEEFQEWVGVFDEEYYLCSWGSFDRKQLHRDCAFHRLESDWVDAHLNLKAQYQEMKQLHRPCGMRNALKREGFEFEGTPHRGISDAENLVKIFRRYLDVWRF